MVLLWSFFLIFAANAQEALLKSCQGKDLGACETLTARYLETGEWSKAFVLGDALCKKEIPMACTYAGRALVQQGKIKEAYQRYSSGCDQFEPLSCSALAQMMGKAKEEGLGQLFLKKACYFGASDDCLSIRKEKSYFSPAGKKVVASVPEECEIPTSSGCQTIISLFQKCAPPLTREDCLHGAGYLSIFFRMKLVAEEAKVLLLYLHAYQKQRKDDPKIDSYSYDLAKVMREFQPSGPYQYVIGFMRECGRKHLWTKRPLTTSFEAFPRSYSRLSARTKANVLAYFEKGKKDECYDPKSGYEAFAVGAIDPLNPSRIDVWKIDQDKRLLHHQPGLPLP